ncbi:hypothetical protein [Dysgonomonas sp. 520]|uniref:hypothetical protein n=1 Tax=Dysgonomonas sp. 520 TaxID=2302931 RepID=UPI0013D16537|nr:hypothetical protein [Dysgonomonas sp. 520]
MYLMCFMFFVFRADRKTAPTNKRMRVGANNIRPHISFLSGVRFYAPTFGQSGSLPLQTTPKEGGGNSLSFAED